MNKRDMYYSNYNAGGFVDPQMYPNQNMMGPQGFTQNNSYQAFGPNVMPNNAPINQNYYPENDFDARITKLERQIRSLDTRLSKLENIGNVEEDITFNSNTYMI